MNNNNWRFERISFLLETKDSKNNDKKSEEDDPLLSDEEGKDLNSNTISDSEPFEQQKTTFEPTDQKTAEPKEGSETEPKPKPEPEAAETAAETEKEPGTEPKPKPEPEAAETEKEPETEPKPEPEPEAAETEEEPEQELFDTITAKYSEIFPTKDTITIIAHSVEDGILSVAMLNKILKPDPDEDAHENDQKNIRIFFTSPVNLFSTLAKSIPDLNKLDDEEFSIGQLYICDLPLHRDTLLASSIYDNLKWFDHHEIDSSEQYDSELEHAELIIDPSADSATSVISEYYEKKDDLVEIANDINSNNVKSENAQRIREIVGAILLKYSGSKLKWILFDFASKLAEDIQVIYDELYNPVIEDYQKWLEDFKKYTNKKIQIHTIHDHKIGILETENYAPVYAVQDNLKEHNEAPFDVIAVVIHKFFKIGKDRNNKYKNKRYTHIELRTHTDDEILELAKTLGGNGHKYASGATLMDGLQNEELLKTITSHFSVN